MPVSPIQPERYCPHCGVKLSRYNPDALCWSCQQGKRGSRANTGVSSSPLGSHVHHSAFTLRSILDTVQRTKPIHFSDVGQVLKHYRSVHCVRQRDLADLLGFDQSYISKLENGQNVRDIATLKHIADRLALPSQWFSLVAGQNSGIDSTELIEVAPSVIRLSQIARESGRSDAAVNELWPLILRLETHTEQDNENASLMLTLASAHATLGIILGDLLPEESLWMSVHFFKKAVAVVDEFGDNFMKAEVYRGCGNELRKQKQYAEAITYLEQALFLASDAITKGLAAALLARTYGEMRDWENFRDAMQTALYFQDKVSSYTPVFNPVMLQEVRIRGLVSVRHVSEVPSLLQQDVARSLSISIAPQWHVLSSLTKAEAQFSLGNLDDGLANLKKALMGAEICKLPHQVQRAIRATKIVDSYTPAQNLALEAQLLLDKLSEETLQLSMPR